MRSWSATASGGELHELGRLGAVADLAELIMRGIQDADSFGEAERTRFFSFLMAIFRTYEELHQLDKRGLVESGFWRARSRSMRNWLAYPGVRSWWSSGGWSEMCVDSFRAAINREIESLDSSEA
jgi:hypothetical protein